MTLATEQSVIFAGTPAFADVCLKALLAAGVVPRLVLTQPDRPAGRGRRLRESDVKRTAVAAGIEVYQPATLKSDAVRERLAAEHPDFLIVAAYGLLLPERLLALPRRAPLNVHASLLPRWRGAAPIQAAILAGDAETGISLMHMDAGLDTGAVYARSALAIAPGETAGELRDRLASLGGELLVEYLGPIARAELSAVAQSADGVSVAGRIAKADALIDWRQPATLIARAVRAYNPWPVSYTTLDGNTLRVWSAVARAAETDAAPGTIIAAGADGIVVACGDGALFVHELQLTGKRRIAASDFANQRPLAGLMLGA